MRTGNQPVAAEDTKPGPAALMWPSDVRRSTTEKTAAGAGLDAWFETLWETMS
jgi:hypothetical protein